MLTLGLPCPLRVLTSQRESLNKMAGKSSNLEAVMASKSRDGYVADSRVGKRRMHRSSVL